MDALFAMIQGAATGGVTVAGGTTMDTINTIVLQLLRWAHFFFGIAWIGHLYYFNFVQAHAEKALDAAMKKVVVPNFRGRAIWWFRWGAMITFLTGITYLLYEQFVATNQHFMGEPNWFKSPGNQWILFGMLLGTIMWFNVWFVIWPRQKQIIAGVATGNKPADFDALVATAGKFSRINTYLSVPMLFGMGARKHFAEIGLGSMGTGLTMLGVFAVGFGIAYHVVNGAAAKVGTEFSAMLPPPPAPAAPPPAAK